MQSVTSLNWFSWAKTNSSLGCCSRAGQDQMTFRHNFKTCTCTLVATLKLHIYVIGMNIGPTFTAKLYTWNVLSALNQYPDVHKSTFFLSLHVTSLLIWAPHVMIEVLAQILFRHSRCFSTLKIFSTHSQTWLCKLAITGLQRLSNPLFWNSFWTLFHKHKIVLAFSEL